MPSNKKSSTLHQSSIAPFGFKNIQDIAWKRMWASTLLAKRQCYQYSIIIKW